MNPGIAAALWTVMVLMWSRSGWLVFVEGIVLFEIFFLSSTLPQSPFQEWPLLRPSSAPMCVVAGLLVVFNLWVRVRRFRASSGPSKNEPARR